MNLVDIKNKFIGLLTTNLGVFDIETQKEIISKMKSEWLDEYIYNISKDYCKCDKCNHYHLNSDYTEETVIEIQKDVFLEFPLDPNDPDEIWGDAKFEVKYRVCPRCAHKKEISKKRLECYRFYYV